MSYLRQPSLSEYYGILGQKRCFVSTAGKTLFLFPQDRRAGRSVLSAKKQGQRVCPRKKGRRVIGAFFTVAEYVSLTI